MAFWPNWGSVSPTRSPTKFIAAAISAGVTVPSKLS
jgi:hypothetical protein